jgi:SAM-dependent methyltransferase
MIRTGRIFDMGCGRGSFLKIMKQDGWAVQGLELNKALAESIQAAHQIPVLSGDLLKAKLPPGSFEVITISHVLEHVRRPRQIIEECYRLLRPGGLLVISIPHIGSLQSRLGGRVWFHLDVPNHLHHFTEKGLLDLVTKIGLQPVSVRRIDIEYGLYGWIQTMLNLLPIRTNALYDILKHRQLKGQGAKRPGLLDLIVSLSMIPLVVPLSFVLLVVEALLRRSGVVEITAQKA